MKILNKIIVINVMCILSFLVMVSIVYGLIQLFIMIIFPLVSFSIFIFIVFTCIMGIIGGKVLEEKIYLETYEDDY